MNGRVLGRATVIGAAMLLATGLSGCSVLSGGLGGSSDAPRASASGQVTAGSNIDIFNLKVGDCKLKDAGAQISGTDVVPCDQPHDEEVFYEFALPDGPYDESAIGTAAETCDGAPFTDFIGVAFDSSALDVNSITPTRDTWEKMNDRLVQCIVSDPAGQTKGSLRGSAK
ncbi:septum formation family protein [Microbacterium sp. ASV81]|uniref:Septum formation family protein n=1 Tax=Microbacterium capsulatum TaxID=3041921 RepID=A0ABU0XDV9_9MICO|nr:septum formation family protein [Microbacterium sp. ASV81]MDQ4213308.1 septum formation family protein [Microbacterium sp. ASV81]